MGGKTSHYAGVAGTGNVMGTIPLLPMPSHLDGTLVSGLTTAPQAISIKQNRFNL